VRPATRCPTDGTVATNHLPKGSRLRGISPSIAPDRREDLATIVSLTGSTHSRSGLRVRSELDRAEYPVRGVNYFCRSADLIVGEYPGGVTVTDAQLATVRLERHRFHGDWNYTIHPATRKPDKSVVV
jgi:hypothetical protein